MTIVKVKLSDLPSELTEEEKRMLNDLKSRPIVYDEDCPPMTKEQLEQVRQVREKQLQNEKNVK